MSTNFAKYDPWGPISAALFDSNNSDLVQNAIRCSGVPVEWPPFGRGDTHKTRIRVCVPVIEGAYQSLRDEEKGRFAQTVAKRIWESNLDGTAKERMRDSLRNIGWDLRDDGALTTQDALVAERFLPAGTEHDAYVAIREILWRANTSLLIVDNYIGGMLLGMVGASPARLQSVHLLTIERSVTDDLKNESQKFRQQYSSVDFKLRTTRNFHDRFILIDGSEVYHIGASIKDAGKRAFLISRLKDEPVLEAVKQYVLAEWQTAKDEI